MASSRVVRWIDSMPFLLFGLFAWLLIRAPQQINHDCAYVLQCAQILTMGGRPYVDFIDINPPLIFYLNMLPVYASEATHLPLPLVFSLFVLSTLGLSTLILWYLFRRPELNLKPLARTALLLGWILCSLFVYTSGDFGQRDYLVILFAFPFVMVRVIRYYGDAIPTASALMIGTLAGLGLCLKPNFLLLALVPELVALVRTRRFSLLATAETVACVSVFALYGLHFFFLPAIVRTELFGRWIPFFARYYSSINLNLFEYVFMQPAAVVGFVMLGCFAALALLVMHRRRMTSLRIEMLSGLVVGSFLSYWIQQKGYSYHALPAKISFIMLTLFLSLWWFEEIMHRREHIPFRRLPAVLPAVVILAGIAVLSIHSYQENRDYVGYSSFEPYREAIINHSTPNDHVLFLNTILFPAYPTLVQTDRLPASRYLTAFPLAGFYLGATPARDGEVFRYRSRQSMSAEERRFLSELSDDIDRTHPELVFIRSGRHCSAMPEGFELVEYFKAAGMFSGALREYRQAGRVADFILFVRNQKHSTTLAHQSE